MKVMKWLGMEKPKAQKVETTLMRAEDIRDPAKYYSARGIEALNAYMRGEVDRSVFEQATTLATMAQRGEL